MNEQEAPEKTQTWKGSIQEVKAGLGNLGGMETEFEHRWVGLGRPLAMLALLLLLLHWADPVFELSF